MCAPVLTVLFPIIAPLTFNNLLNCCIRLPARFPTSFMPLHSCSPLPALSMPAMPNLRPDRFTHELL